MSVLSDRFIERCQDFLLGKPLDISNNAVKKPLAMAALLAWIGLGADGLSSFCYGPEQAFLALENHTHLAIYLSLATAITVFILALAYNQIIELFPTGGGSYRITTRLIGPYAGLVSGSALIIDYVLTIVISIAAATDALFSLFPAATADQKILIEGTLIILLLASNLRGLRESIFILLPIFIGFCLLHGLLIMYGFYAHADWIPELVPASVNEVRSLADNIGWFAVAAFFLKAYSLGGGTYTGIEVVPNHSQSLAEPKVKTGKLTMFYMACSLALLSAGLIIVYLLWAAYPEPGQTLNAVVFGSIIQHMGLEPGFASILLISVLVFEALILLVAANSGFLSGTSVLANMSADSWLPHQFGDLSRRLVAKNNLIVMAFVAMAVLWWTKGDVALLVILYSINVFISFALSMLGLCRYWIKYRLKEKKRWKNQLAWSITAFLIAMLILASILWSKFTSGAWFSLVLTGSTAIICLFVRAHYRKIRVLSLKAEKSYDHLPYGSSTVETELNPALPTAVIIVKLTRGSGLFPLQWILKKFPGYFHNFVFINAAVVDSTSYDNDQSLALLQQETVTSLKYFENYAKSQGLAAKTYSSFGTNMVEQLIDLTHQVERDFPNAMFFSSILSLETENWFSRLLGDRLPFMVQRNLHQRGQQMLILPVKL